MTQHIVAISGGVGGAKLALGLSKVLSPEQLSIVTNTADDFVHLGLNISPDIDTVMYTLAEINNKEQGWGLEGESWQMMESLKKLNPESSWFLLGDKDIATHLARTEMLKQEKSLTEITDLLRKRLGVQHRILPMCNETVSTFVKTESHEMPFQEYFVKHQCKPCVSGFSFKGIDNTCLSDEVTSALEKADAVIICPSNPFVSVEPVLQVAGFRDYLVEKDIPVVVVSPIVNGMAIKGPAAKMMDELDMPVTPVAIAEYYQDLATHFVMDKADASDKSSIEGMGLETLICNTIMKSLDDRIQLAKVILDMLQINSCKEVML